MATLEVVRVVVEGPITSFRQPYFIQGVQPTYEVPPPATLFGHVCSALGQWVSRADFRIAFTFTHQGRFMDYEHLHLFGREPKLSPFLRELLFQPRLVLYVDRPDWLMAFRHPAYVVTLGRSQDLMTYREVRLVRLEQRERAYVECSLLPAGMSVERFQMLNLPRYINEARQVEWALYKQVGQPQIIADGPVWTDTESADWRGLQRGVIWLGFTHA